MEALYTASPIVIGAIAGLLGALTYLRFQQK